MKHKYTETQTNFIKKNIEGRRIDELTKMFNLHFNLELKPIQIRAFVKNNKLKSGLNCKFKTGQISFNKGKKGVGGWKPTQFKKGCKPYNYMEVGSERINGEGYTDIKIEDPNKWRGKHLIVWEQHNGLVPNGYVVLFGDRNKRNFNIDNLILVSRQQLLILIRNKLIQNDANLTRTGVIIADVYQKISERKN